jgi:hypothetical protein
MNEDLKTLLEKDSQRKPSTDKLDFVRDQIRYLRDLDIRIGNAEDTTKALRIERRDLVMSTLPDIFSQTKIDAITLQSEGNMPAYEAELKDYYRASINADWPPEKRDKALAWLRKHGLGDLIKTVVTIELGRGQATLLKKILAALRKLKVPFKTHDTIPWNTLTAAIKEMYQEGKPLKDAELELLGATVGRTVTIKQQKDN